ncbi:MAG: hypothetical protein KC503_08120 [Myxococcales bacterium]|nr:hypothetical protein [Myxococcales bacterium]
MRSASWAARLLTISLLLLCAAPARATCWVDAQRGKCCQAPGGPMHCTPFTEDELRRERERQRELRRETEERSRKWREQQQRLREERARRERWRREHPEKWRQQQEAERRQRLWLQRQRERQRRTRRLTPAPRRPPPRTYWDRAQWFEAGAGAAAFVSAVDGASTYGGGGVAVSFAAFWRRRYAGSSLLSSRGSLGLAAIPIVGPLFAFFAVPKSAFIGNELGATVSAQLSWSSAARFRTLLLFEPRLRVSPRSGRFRINSLVGTLLPKIGIEIESDGTRRWALETYNLAFACALTTHLALELEAAMLVREGDEDRRPSVGGSFRLKLLAF